MSIRIINSPEKNEKRKRVSKKNKKSWRKHTNVEDVEDFLEDQRLEERLGGPLVKRDDHFLFEVDKVLDEEKKEETDDDEVDFDTGFEDEEIPEKTKSKKDKKLSRKEWRTKLLNKPYNVYKILEPDTQVPDPIAKRNHVRTKAEREHPLTKIKQLERKKKEILKNKEKDIVRRRKIEERKENEPTKGIIKKDIWGEEDKTFIDNLGEDQVWLDKDTILHTKKNTGCYKKKREDQIIKPYIIPAVEAPHPGMSYNPSFKDHQHLLGKVTEAERKLMKEEEHLNRVVTKMFKKVTPEQQHKAWLDEMSQGLPNSEQNKEEKLEIDEDVGIVKSINPPALNKKKNLQKRRRLREQHMQELEKQKERIEKKKLSDLYKIKFMNKDFEKTEKKVSLLRKKREKIQEYKKKEAKQLSKTKFKPLDLDFNMPNELKGSLRLIKEEGSILKERFNSLQKRNLIETRTKQRKSKPKVKKYVKRSHRDPEEETQPNLKKKKNKNIK